MASSQQARDARRTLTHKSATGNLLKHTDARHLPIFASSINRKQSKAASLTSPETAQYCSQYKDGPAGRGEEGKDEEEEEEEEDQKEDEEEDDDEEDDE